MPGVIFWFVLKLLAGFGIALMGLGFILLGFSNPIGGYTMIAWSTPFVVLGCIAFLFHGL